MKCVICKGEDIQKTTVKEELKIGNDIIYGSTPNRVGELTANSYLW